MESRTWVIVVFSMLLAGAVFVWVGASLGAGFGAPGGSSGNASFAGFDVFSGKCVAVIPVQGEIVYAAGPPSVAGGLIPAGNSVSSTDLAEAFKEAQRRDDVVAVFLDVNSPGGSAAASKEAFDAIRTVHKPSVAFISEMGTSGAYYLAAGATEIVANPNALTGSIGAVLHLLNYGELFHKLGVREDVIKSGALKDIGSATRNLTREERAVLDSLIAESFANFKDDVQWARGDRLEPELFKRVLDARLLSARQALDAGLIDSIGNREFALRVAAERGGLNVGVDEDVPTCDFSKPSSGLGDLFSILGARAADGFWSRVTAPGAAAPSTGGVGYR